MIGELGEALPAVRDLTQQLEGEASATGARLAATLASLLDDPAALARLERALVGHLPGELDRLAGLLEAETVELEDLPELLRRRLLADDGRASWPTGFAAWSSATRAWFWPPPSFSAAPRC